MKIREDWLINNKNVFGLSDEVSVAFYTIQSEILNQIDKDEISLISEYLNLNIEITTQIKLTNTLTIENILDDHLKLNFNPLKVESAPVYLILGYLQIELLKNYSNERCKNILTLTEYKKQYQTLCNEYLSNNIDTDEEDFIKSELKLCSRLITELKKPIYNVLGILGDVLESDCNFKKHLTNSIDKRIKFLKIKEEQAGKYIPIEKHVITKRSKTYFRCTSDYVYSEKKLLSLKYQMGSNQVEKYIKNRTHDDNGDYKFTHNREIDSKISYAVKRDYRIFNINNKNFREIEFDNIGRLEVFKIDDVEYIIESNEKEDHEISISVYNCGFAEKWLKFLDGLIGNYCFGTLKGVKEDIVEDAQKKGINNIDNFAGNIESLFNHCLDFHNNKRFEGVNYNVERYKLLNCINTPGGIFWWKQKKWRDVNKCIGNLMTELEDLFITVNPSIFMQVRDFIILWIEKAIDITINNETRMFQWAYSPFMDDVFNLGDKLKKRFSDDRIILKNSLHNTIIKPPQKTRNKNNKPNLKQEPYLKDLFINNGNDYDNIIDSLIENKFVTKNENGTLNWKGAEEDKSLADKTLICTLAIILDNKNYFEPNLSKTYIAKALTNTFKNITIIAKTFGETLNNFSNKPHYSKPFFFIN